MRLWGVRAFFLLVLGSSLFGCGAPSDWAKLDLPPATLESGWTILSNPDAGITFNVPKGWEKDDASVEKSAKIRAKFAQFYSGFNLILSAEDLDLAAVDTSEEGIGTGTIRALGVEIVDPPNIGDFSLTNLNFKVEGQLVTGPVITETTLGKMAMYTRSERNDNLRTGGESNMIHRIYIFGRGKVAWVFTIAFPAENEAEFKPTLDKILASIRISETTVAKARATRKTRNDRVNAANSKVYEGIRAQEKAAEEERQRRMQEESERYEAEKKKNEETLRNMPDNQMPQDEGPDPQSQQQSPPDSSGQ
jgi:hypothetical protein